SAGMTWPTTWRRLPCSMRCASEARLAATARQLLLLDREDGAVLHLDVLHDTGAAGLVLEADVVASRGDAGDAQPLVVIDLVVAIVLALVAAPGLLPGRRQLQRHDGIPREIPEPRGLVGGQ